MLIDTFNVESDGSLESYLTILQSVKYVKSFLLFCSTMTKVIFEHGSIHHRFSAQEAEMCLVQEVSAEYPTRKPSMYGMIKVRGGGCGITSHHWPQSRKSLQAPHTYGGL